MATEKKLTMEVGGLEADVPELSLSDHIPPPPVEDLLPILIALPGEVLQIADDLPDMLRIPDLDHDMEAGA